MNPERVQWDDDLPPSGGPLKSDSVNSEEGEAMPIEEMLRKFARDRRIEVDDDDSTTQSLRLMILREKRDEAKEERAAKAAVRAEADATAARRQFWLRYVLPAAIAALSGTGYGGFVWVKSSAVAEAKQQKDVTKAAGAGAAAAVTDVADTAKAERTQNAADVKTLAGLAVEQQTLTVESTAFIADKIDAAHPKHKGAVKKTKAMDDAEKAVAGRKRDADAGKILGH